MSAAGTGERLGYIPAIDGLRAVAVGSVVAFHLWPGLLPGGYTGVDIFFVISGFVVTGSLLGKSFGTLKEFAAYFYARRLMRIMPALVAMLLATILATQLFIPEGWLSRTIPNTARLAFFGLSNVVLATDADSYFGPLAGYNPFTHTWSLGVEEQFYLAFPLLLYWHQRLHSGDRAIRWVAGLSAASLLLCAVLTFVANKYAFFLIFTRFWELGVGMLLCMTRERWSGWAARQRWLAPASALLIAGDFLVREGLPFPFPLALLPVLGTGGMIAAICAGRGPRLLSQRAVVALGLLSYSLYLWHWPVFVLFRWTSGLHTLPLQLIALGIAVALAIGSYRLVERPLRAHPRIAALPRPRIVRRALLATLVAAVAGHLLIVAHDRITLSVTGNRDAWYAEPGRPLDPAIAHCEVERSVRATHGGKVTEWQPGCPVAFTLFVPGDSHGVAYAPALHQLAAEKGVRVRQYFRAACPYLKLTETHASRPGCAGWYAMIRDEIAAEAKPGDVIFLPGLRLTRIANQFEGDRDILNAKPDRVSDEALVEARGVLHQLAQTGARIVLEAAKPLFPSPTFRCADWFNRANPICHGLTIPQAEMLERRRDVMRAMSALAVAEPTLTLWDPLPILCPHETCEALPAGRPLFVDGDHISGLGNDLLYPALRDAITGTVQERSPWRDAPTLNPVD